MTFVFIEHDWIISNQFELRRLGDRQLGSNQNKDQLGTDLYRVYKKGINQFMDQGAEEVCKLCPLLEKEKLIKFAEIWMQPSNGFLQKMCEIVELEKKRKK